MNAVAHFALDEPARNVRAYAGIQKTRQSGFLSMIVLDILKLIFFELQKKIRISI